MLPQSAPFSAEQIAQARERGVRARLDRAERLAQALGELGLRQAVEVGQHEHLALRRRQPVERHVDAAPLEAVAARSAARRRTATVSGSSAVGVRRARLLAAHEVDGLVVHERQQPRRGLRAGRVESAAPRQTARNPSCTASSASDASRTIRSARP